MLIKIIGVLLIIDGIWSLLTPKNYHWFMGDLGRWARTICGLILIFSGMEVKIIANILAIGVIIWLCWEFATYCPNKFIDAIKDLEKGEADDK